MGTKGDTKDTSPQKRKQTTSVGCMIKALEPGLIFLSFRASKMSYLESKRKRREL